MRSTFAAASAVAVLALVACNDTATKTQTVMVPATSAATAATPAPSGGRCTPIVIDPGHNARPNPATEPIGPRSPQRKIKDGGGTSGVVTRVPESVVNLQIAMRLRKLLVADGYCVTMTRTRQSGVSMGNIARARIANRAHAALFVRIHADGTTSRPRHSTSPLCPAFHRGWPDAILPASRIAALKLQRRLGR